jgi:hypothetical protein
MVEKSIIRERGYGSFKFFHGSVTNIKKTALFEGSVQQKLRWVESAVI